MVEAARGGDVDSFAELYRRHYAGMVGIAYCVLSDRHLAEDAAQETFAIACRDLGRLRRVDKFTPWLGGICRKVAKGIARRKGPQLAQEDLSETADTSPGENNGELVRLCVGQLPRGAREVVLLHYFAGLTHQQIAPTLDITPQAVHGRLIRARRKLTEKLSRHGLGGRDS